MIFEWHLCFSMRSLCSNIPQDDIVGETIIDLEDRLISACRATCGLAKTYTLSGRGLVSLMLAGSRPSNGLCDEALAVTDLFCVLLLMTCTQTPRHRHFDAHTL